MTQGRQRQRTTLMVYHASRLTVRMGICPRPSAALIALFSHRDSPPSFPTPYHLAAYALQHTALWQSFSNVRVSKNLFRMSYPCAEARGPAVLVARDAAVSNISHCAYICLAHIKPRQRLRPRCKVSQPCKPVPFLPFPAQTYARTALP